MSDTEIIVCLIGACCSIITWVLVWSMFNFSNYKENIKELNRKLDLILKAENNTGS